MRPSLISLPPELTLVILEHLVAAQLSFDLTPILAVLPKHLAYFIVSPTITRHLRIHHHLHTLPPNKLHLTVAVGRLVASSSCSQLPQLPDDNSLQNPVPCYAVCHPTSSPTSSQVQQTMTSLAKYLSRLASSHNIPFVRAEWGGERNVDKWYTGVCKRWLAWTDVRWQRGYQTTFEKEYNDDDGSLVRLFVDVYEEEERGRGVRVNVCVAFQGVSAWGLDIRRRRER